MANVWRTIFRRPQTTTPRGTLDGLPKLFSEAQEVLYSVSTVFPFIVFPDKIIIRRNHVDVVKGIFFGSAESQRMLYSDIREMLVSHNPFFASIHFVLIGPPDIYVNVKFMPKGRAMHAKRIISGLIECDRKKVDVSKYTNRELRAYLEEIGKTSE